MRTSKLSLEEKAESSLSWAVKGGVLLTAYLMRLSANKIIQEGRRAFYAASGVSYQRVDDDPERSFFYYTRT